MAQVQAYVEAQTAAKVAGDNFNAKWHGWTPALDAIDERVAALQAKREAVYQQAVEFTVAEESRSVEAEQARDEAREAVIETAKAVRGDQKVFVAVDQHGREWFVETKAAPPIMVLDETGDYDALAEYLTAHWPSMIDVVMPRRPALPKLKALIGFAEKYGQPLPLVSLKSQEVKVTIREPEDTEGAD